ncbi:MAG TPA: ATP-binding protein [Pseudonocardiaceae bacterium]|nr:ATP-binding protein [Pseudonocardiaceae bacterium]
MSSVEDRDELLRLTITGEQDVFLVRQRGREVATAVGLHSQDQVRVATVLSDLGRDLVRDPINTRVVFRMTATPVPALVIELSWRGAAAPETRVGASWHTAGRLMTEVRTSHEAGRHGIVLVKNLPDGVLAGNQARLEQARQHLTKLGRSSALDELRAQNQELLDTLDELEHKQAELVLLNDELAETNQGVLALYKELGDELEQTNRGVVALYAELDEKSTQLREASEAKTRFWSNISHELRTPINSVIGLGRLLSAGGERLTEDQRRQISLITESGTTLLALVNELLDTAKAESGLLEPLLTPIDLGVLFIQLRGTLRPVVPSADVELVIDEPPQLPPLMTDEVMLGRILRNLLSNSLKFTEHGQVRLFVTPDPERQRLDFVVTDTGIGIPADEQIKVFEEFHQVPNELQARSAGTGLGLPYARRLAEILGGELTLESAVGRGTTVTLRLPATYLDTSSTPVLDAVLLVDDDADFRAVVRGMIQDLARTVTEAGDGRTALDAITERRPDLILLDLTMPTMGGVDVLGILRRDPTLRHIPVVVITAASVAGLELTGPRLRAAVLSKSQVSPESIRHAVARALAAAPLPDQWDDEDNGPGRTVAP